MDRYGDKEIKTFRVVLFSIEPNGIVIYELFLKNAKKQLHQWNIGYLSLRFGAPKENLLNGSSENALNFA